MQTPVICQLTPTVLPEILHIHARVSKFIELNKLIEKLPGKLAFSGKTYPRLLCH